MANLHRMKNDLSTIDDIHISHGQRCLVRMDCNVPIQGGRVVDNFRIRKSLPTLQHILHEGGCVVAVSHIGRPSGKSNSGLVIEPVRRELENLLSTKVKNAGGPYGKEPMEIANSLKSGEIAVLENLRFHPGEEKNSQDFAENLAGLGTIFVNDAFGTAHRAHASTVGVTEFMPSVCGFLLKQEIDALDSVINLTARPAIAIVGGAKLSDKLKAAKWFASKMDTTIIGGGMAKPFLEAKYGGKRSLNHDAQAAQGMLEEFGNKIVLPDDIVATGHFETGQPQNYDAREFAQRDSGEKIADIGITALESYRERIKDARLIVWNGPMGVVENPLFSRGTHGVLKAIARSNAPVKLAGGGSTLEVIDRLGLDTGFTMLSTGGGAMLQYLMEGTLPAIDAIRRNRYRLSEKGNTFE